MNVNAHRPFLDRFDRPGELVSWALFLGSAVFFVISALRSGDVPGLIGALLFLFACVIFLVPYLSRALRIAHSNGS